MSWYGEVVVGRGYSNFKVGCFIVISSSDGHQCNYHHHFYTHTTGSGLLGNKRSKSKNPIDHSCFDT